MALNTIYQVLNRNLKLTEKALGGTMLALSLREELP